MLFMELRLLEAPRNRSFEHSSSFLATMPIFTTEYVGMVLVRIPTKNVNDIL